MYNVALCRKSCQALAGASLCGDLRGFLLSSRIFSTWIKRTHLLNPKPWLRAKFSSPCVNDNIQPLFRSIRIVVNPTALNTKKLFTSRGHGPHQTGWLYRAVLGVVTVVLCGVTWGISRFQTQCEVEPRETKNVLNLEIEKGNKLSARKEKNFVVAIEKAQDLAKRIKDETGTPGLTIAVSVNGQLVWSEGLGYADVENRLPCSPDTVLRIASISKSITMAAVARMWESGDLDIDKPIQHYVPSFPEKYWNGEKVTITTRQLVSHLGGIRHYDKSYIQKQEENKREKEENNKTNEQLVKGDNQSGKTFVQSVSGENQKKKDEMEQKEYYINRTYKSVTEGLKLFQDDPLVHKPESGFLYTTHGWTLVSAVLEGAAKMPFEKLIVSLFQDLGLENTYLDKHAPLIYHRGRHYVKNKKGRLINAPYVDNSYKWAGGGFLSNVKDLIKFGNAMLYSFQFQDSDSGSSLHSKESHCAIRPSPPGFIMPETMRALWSPVKGTQMSWDSDGLYGMGWGVVLEKYEYGHCKEVRYYVSHTGGAIGASSVLLILPFKSEDHLSSEGIPKGVVVAMLANMMSVGLNRTALQIAKIFEEEL
ncbi:hypothetical protein CHS0354_001044 [Potamilus streckersoni]|uniref:Beta-lactamase-related domain-containing protein n=1 Tax=Potamilus streckersoni TaxID=2493646 RepID=A0AAE0SUT1_9BIVA|nr:hypothetical protein CHS0354_001044 [Potamilus streckersoni]